MSKKNDRNRENAELLLTSKGWTKNRWGHFVHPEREDIRAKFQKTSFRIESKCVHDATMYSERSVSWVRLRTVLYSKCKKPGKSQK